MSDNSSIDKLGEGLKKILLAGVGAAALTGEKAQDVLDKLVEKGELTVEQGKALNEELKHKVKETKEEQKEDEDKDTKEQIQDILNGMSSEQLESLKSLLNAVKKEEETEKPAAEEEKSDD